MSALTLQSAVAQAPAPAKVAATPPMGWNSWDSYGLTITEDQFRANVKVLSSDLKKFGWTYAVIDEGWFFFNPEDRPRPDTLVYAIDTNGRYVPVPRAFRRRESQLRNNPRSNSRRPPEQLPPPAQNPSSTPPRTSFKALADYVHSLGLKFGIHIVRGIPRVSVPQNLPIASATFHAADAADTTDACPWDPTDWGVQNNLAGQAWYDSLLTQYAAWGVDLIKVDCIASHPYKIDEIRMIRRAIDKAGRPMVLSLSPGPTSLDHAAEVAAEAQMWRVSDDFWDTWNNPSGRAFPQSLFGQFTNAAAWAPFTKPGNWPDADMLPIGELRPHPATASPAPPASPPPSSRRCSPSGPSPARRSSWAPTSPCSTARPSSCSPIRTSSRIDQTATRSGQVIHDGDIIAWTADLPPGLPGGSTALALFNARRFPGRHRQQLRVYGLDDATYRVKDAWTGKNLGKVKSVSGLTLEPHAATLWLLKK